jgi:hypothetical protein
MNINMKNVVKLKSKSRILNQRTARAREEFASNEGHQNRAQPCGEAIKKHKRKTTITHEIKYIL